LPGGVAVGDLWGPTAFCRLLCIRGPTAFCRVLCIWERTASAGYFLCLPGLGKDEESTGVGTPTPSGLGLEFFPLCRVVPRTNPPAEKLHARPAAKTAPPLPALARAIVVLRCPRTQGNKTLRVTGCRAGRAAIRPPGRRRYKAPQYYGCLLTLSNFPADQQLQQGIQHTRITSHALPCRLQALRGAALLPRRHLHGARGPAGALPHGQCLLRAAQVPRGAQGKGGRGSQDSMHAAPGSTGQQRGLRCAALCVPPPSPPPPHTPPPTPPPRVYLG
jgi:hypothetical protein